MLTNTHASNSPSCLLYSLSSFCSVPGVTFSVIDNAFQVEVLEGDWSELFKCAVFLGI
eukprot:m.109049 g.109049  ORF g.109049 m.109049 type:complete len:58 (+) comp13362_c0_seq1:1825-1998(+)